MHSRSSIHKSIGKSRNAFLRTATIGIIAATRLATTSNRDVGECKVGAAAITTENIIIHAIISYSSGDIDKRYSSDGDTIRGITSRATVEIVLLNVDSVVCDARNSDVLVSDVANLYPSSLSEIFSLKLVGYILLLDQ